MAAATPEPTPTEFDKLTEALKDSSAHGARQMTVFVLFLVYMLITVAATTDRQFFLPDSKVTLPVLTVELPLEGFFIVAPALVIILHFNLLLHLLHHARKLKAWREADPDQEHVLLPGFILNYALIFIPGTINYRLLRVLQAVILCFSPLALLLFVQIRYAANHDVAMTAWHFVLVGLDVFVLLIYWYRIIYPDLLDSKYDGFRKLLTFPPVDREIGYARVVTPRLPIRRPHAWAAGVVLAISTPLGPLRMIPRGLRRSARPIKDVSAVYMPMFATSMFVSAGCLLIVSLVCYGFYDRYGLLAGDSFLIPRLDLSGQTLVKSEPGDAVILDYLNRGKTKEDAWADFVQGIEIRKGRDLRFALLDDCNLLHAKLPRAHLNCADLDHAELNGANLGGAELNGADLDRAKLNGANLWGAELNGAVLWGADLNGAYLRVAQLNGADLTYAELNGADLEHAELNGADLEHAELNGADLLEAELNGAVLLGAELNGANLWGAELNGPYLRYAELNGAYLEQTRLRGSRLDTTLARGIYFYFEPDIDTIPDWNSLKADSIKIPAGDRRRVYLAWLDTAMAYADYVDPFLQHLQPDSAGFVEERKQLACRNTWIAVGLFSQEIGDSSFTAQLKQMLVEHIQSECPDSLTTILSRIKDPDVRREIDGYIKQKPPKP